MNLLRIYHTLINLLPVQVYGRLLFFLKRKLLPVGNPGRLCKLAAELKTQLPLDRNATFSLCFLNRACSFGYDKVLWQSGQYYEKPEKLWVYQLNYFDWLFDGQTDCYSLQNLYLILDWIEKNSSSRAESWEPFPLSRRITAWVRWCREHPALPSQAGDCIKDSILCQCDRLWFDLEYHNQANHLFENLQALFVATVFLASRAANLTPLLLRRLEFCALELLKQIELQFFADGGHFERSPMYHREMLESVESVKSACEQLLQSRCSDKILEERITQLKTLCEERVPKMRTWLALLTHPDGMIAQFNDSAQLPGILYEGFNSGMLLEDSGFFVRHASDSYFAMSCGNPSPVFQPGHTHCDILSYEFSLGGRRCVVDTGCGSYQNPQIRGECRQTSAHNLPMIEAAEQSDIWGSFRMGRRAYLLRRAYDADKGLLEVEFTDQYGQQFRREVIFAPGMIKVRDRMSHRRVTGNFVSLLHLSPDVLIQPGNEAGCSNFILGAYKFAISTAARLRIGSYVWYPSFGQPVNAEKIILSNNQSEAIDYVITWKTSQSSSGNPVLLP
ncbi:MAG: hypothetical protein EOM80_07530 [Erysipelotrichia bacterium]|nr:hypothetical protein [Erysipelotrichia bacterium]